MEMAKPKWDLTNELTGIFGLSLKKWG